MIQIPVSWGELIDKLTILEIKSAKIDDRQKLQNIRKELELLRAQLDALPRPDAVHPLIAELKLVNESLWQIEDKIRELEASSRFDDEFVELARSVYKTNDRRASLKRRINEVLGSDLVEEKSYAHY